MPKPESAPPVASVSEVTPLHPRRLEEIGLLTTRMVHDLNNMLTPMLIAMPMLRSAVADPVSRSLLDSLESTVARATGLLRQVGEYARGNDNQFQLLLMRQLLEEIAAFARETFAQKIKVSLKIPADLWAVKVNLVEIHQMLLNLCVNARDAMPEGGALSLGAENCRLDEAAAALVEGGRAGDFLVLQVDDTGTGLSPLVLARMWEPWNTTKPENGGSGLGLSIIRDIVLSHRGFIQFSTLAGKGSTFRIYLPVEPPVAGILPVAPAVQAGTRAKTSA